MTRKAPSPTGINTGVPVARLVHARNNGANRNERRPVGRVPPGACDTGAARILLLGSRVWA